MGVTKYVLRNNRLENSETLFWVLPFKQVFEQKRFGVIFCYYKNFIIFKILICSFKLFCSIIFSFLFFSYH